MSTQITYQFGAEYIGDSSTTDADVAKYRRTLIDVLNADDEVVSYQFAHGAWVDVEVTGDADEEALNDRWHNAVIARGF